MALVAAYDTYGDFRRPSGAHQFRQILIVGTRHEQDLVAGLGLADGVRQSLEGFLETLAVAAVAAAVSRYMTICSIVPSLRFICIPPTH